MKPNTNFNPRMEYQHINMPEKWQHQNDDSLSKLFIQKSEKAIPYPERQNSEIRHLEKTTLCVKNMVSIRCIMAVKAVLKKLELPYTAVELGKVEIVGSLAEKRQKQLKAALVKLGFELMEDRKNVLIEEIKNVIIEMMQYDKEPPKIKISEYLSRQFNHNYTYLSNLFSKIKGTTIEHFILTHKIERVKQLLLYNELTLSEIAWKLHYSSVAHLSNQFKKITGLTPTNFKNMKDKRLIALENL